MKRLYRWNPEKNAKLLRERGISFEEIVLHLEQRHLLGVVRGQGRHADQKQLVVEVNKYVYIVPFIEEDGGHCFLKTIIPSRKLTKKYLRGGGEDVPTSA